MTRPLAGIRVVDFSALLPGPLATLMLAEAGAEIIKIEKPGGDDMRHFPPFLHGKGSAYRLLNRGKTVIELDLKSDEGRAMAIEHVRTADILIEQFRPGIMKRLGLDYPAMSKLNEGLIYCSITGYGQAGPRALEAGHDINYLGNTGLLAQSWGSADAPVLPPAQIADIGGGSMPAVINILLALIGRQRTGKGCRVDIAMCDAMFSFALFAQALAVAGAPESESGKALLTGGSPRYNIYPAKCGTPICVGALEEHFWQRLCETLEIAPQDRNDRREPEIVRQRIERAFRTRPAEAWAPLLANADCCATVMVSFEEALSDPHFRARGLFDHGLGDVRGFVPALPVPIAPLFWETSENSGPS
jgi:crotonobetainyl-CoA:carnitine CoA-transferase CaiB-like acyl-CoA transferase